MRSEVEDIESGLAGRSGLLTRLTTQAVARLRSALSMSTRRRIASRRVALRLRSANARALPNLLIVGAQRCGTSSLYKYLQMHPEVRSSLRKEVEYFTLHFDKGEAWYRAHFPRRAEVEKAGVRVLFEATPNYLFDPRCAERAAAAVPDARIVILLRDPVQRAFSHYQHNRRLGHEPLDFATAIEQEESRTAKGFGELLADPTIALPRAMRRYSYASRGYYADQLLPWLQFFGSDRVLVLASKDLYDHPSATYREITAFLGIADWTPARYDNYSAKLGAGDPTDHWFPESVRKDLIERFDPANRRLEELLGRKLGWSTMRPGRDLPVHEAGSGSDRIRMTGDASG